MEGQETLIAQLLPSRPPFLALLCWYENGEARQRVWLFQSLIGIGCYGLPCSAGLCSTFSPV
jgi:hypothetical protein